MRASSAPAARTAAWPRREVGDTTDVAEIGERLGISEAGARALARAGLLGSPRGPNRFAVAALEAFAERIWRAALPTASEFLGVRLLDAVEAAGSGPDLWPTTIAALLDGRLNAFRRRGAFGAPILAALVVSSERVVAELAATAGDGEAPFIWTPATPQ